MLSLYQTSSPSLTVISVAIKFPEQSLTLCFGVELKTVEDGYDKSLMPRSKQGYTVLMPFVFDQD